MTTHTANNFLGEVDYPIIINKMESPKTSIEQNAPVYPSAPKQNQTESSKRDVNQNISPQAFIQIQFERGKKIKNDIKLLEDKSEHYTKVKRKWSRADKTVRYTGITIGAGLTITEMITGIIGSVGLITPEVLGTAGPIITIISGVESIITQAFGMGIFSKKRKLYQKIVEEVNNTKSKLYVFYQKAKLDGIISNDEMKMAEDIINQMYDNIEAIKYKKKYRVNKSRPKSTVLNNDDEIRNLKKNIHKKVVI